MTLLRRLFLDNWRNKLTALVFAVSIWFVTYQSELRAWSPSVTLEVRPQDPTKQVVLASFTEDPQGTRVRFGGRVALTFNGPRKQIDLLRDRIRRKYSLEVAPTTERRELRQEDFGFPRDGVSVVGIEPSWIEVRQEPVQEVAVNDLHDRIQVVPFRQDVEVLREVVKPESQSVRLRGPQSLVDEVGVRVEVPAPFTGEEVDRLFPLEVTGPDQELVHRTVRVWDWQLRRWVDAGDPPEIHVRVRVRQKDVEFQHDAVRVSFDVPLLQHPYRVLLHDVSGDTIPLEFVGPADAIERLREEFARQPDLAVVVPLPKFDHLQGGTFTFSEDDLRLPGFPEIRMEQHESRRRDLKTAWSYEVRVYPEVGAETSGTER